MSGKLLLGVDEGTTGVKAALFDEKLQPVAEARRDKVNRHPEEGWVEQDGEEVLEAVTSAIAELLADPPGEVVACGLDHQGESILAWEADSGKPLCPIVVWQDKRSQEILDTLIDKEEEVQKLSGLPFDPYFSAAKMAWLLKNDDGVKKALDAGNLRMGTVDSFLCDRLGAGFATDVSTGSRTQLQRIDKPGFDSRLCEIFGVPVEVLPEIRDSAGDLGTLKHESWPVELPLRGQVARPAGRARRGRLRGARPRQGDIRHRRLRARPRRRGRSEAGGGPAADGRLEHRRQGRVRARRRRLRRRCDARVAVRRDGPGRGPARARRDGAGGRQLGRRPGAARPGRHRRPLVASQRPRGALGHLRRHQRGQRRARRARGHRLARRRHRRGDPRDASRSTCSASTAASPTSR